MARPRRRAADTTLLDTDIVYRLASESRIGDTSWIRPGKVAWDWWNFNNVYGVPFRAGVNTDTYKHYIDFAAENGIEYVILDEGWYKLGDLMTQMPGIDMEAIAAHARQKKVGLVMWVIWKTLDLQLAQALDQFEKWGVKGIKVDFMQREDQWMVNYYERVAREAAKRRLLVDFHGAYKPTGLYRTYPNVDHERGGARPRAEQVGRPGVARQRRHVPVHADDGGAGGLHAGRDDERDEGRLQAGLQPADEPGHALPAARDVRRLREPAADAGGLAVELPARAREPGVPGGRAHGMGRDEGAVGATVGEHILVARRSGTTWYVAAMTNWSARDLEVPLSFLAGPSTPLGAGTWEADIYKDGPNADRAAVDYAREKRAVGASDRLRIHLAPGGGFVVKLVKK